MVTSLLSKISTLNEAAAKAEATRRRLHNQLMEVQGNVGAGGSCCAPAAPCLALPCPAPRRPVRPGPALPVPADACARSPNPPPPGPPAPQIRVFCRVRPHPASVVRSSSGSNQLTLAVDGREHPFSFDKVFTPGSQVSHPGLAILASWTRKP